MEFPDPDTAVRDKSPEELEELWKTGVNASAWAKKMRDAVCREVRHRELKLPTQRIVNVQGTRKISDIEKIFEVFKAFGITAEEFISCTYLYYTKLEKLYKAKCEPLDKKHPPHPTATWEAFYEWTEDGELILDETVPGLTIRERVGLLRHITEPFTTLEPGFDKLVRKKKR